MAGPRVTAAQLYEAAGPGRVRLTGDPTLIISRVQSSVHYQPSPRHETLTWMRERQDIKRLFAWFCGVIVPVGLDRVPQGRFAIVHTHPRLALARILHACFADCQFGAEPRGDDGLAYEWDPAADAYIKLPHLYGVVTMAGVDIDARASIKNGILHDTWIGRGTKIGAFANVGHGCRIGSHCLIAPHATLGGSVTTGDHVRIWQGAMIANGIHIGDSATIGMGAVVLKDVPEGETWIGNPACAR